MSRRLDEDDESILPQREPRLPESRLPESRLPESRLKAEREMTLGTGAILAIFFGLVVLCGAFFGFGYKLGSSASKAPITGAPADAADTLPTPPPSTSLSASKPSAGSPIMAPNSSASTAAGIDIHPSAAPVLTPPPNPPVSTRVNPAAASAKSSTEPAVAAPPAVTRSAPAALPPPAIPPPSMPMPATSATGTYVVQVAAVSHTEDADLLVNALHAKGYAVAARSEPGDRLVHIQVGPFNSKKDADTMRQRLLADGYNAFIK